ncbi:MAG: hypothetical protein KZQ94_14690 [Candidatus Thiodiazotropha sp. (ex Troendleina suluensis)]|nr:hypothetical protein [Candidatus Thiodiazotropha sp. (ex Troendleina suluensis)]
MAKKRKYSKKEKSVAAKKALDGKPDEDVIPPPPLYDPHSAKRLSLMLGITANRLGLSRSYASTIHDRLFFPLRLLTLLRKEADAVLCYDPTAPDRFIEGLRTLRKHLPAPSASLANMDKVVRTKRSSRGKYPSAQLVTFEAIAPLYQAAFLASGGNTEIMHEAFGHIASLSHAEQTLESLHRNLGRGGQAALDDQFAWGVASARGPFCGGSSPGRGPEIDPSGNPWGGGPEGDPWGGGPEGDPWGGGPEGDPWGGLPGGWIEPDDPEACDEPAWPILPGDDNSLRLGCEGLLIDIFNSEAPSLKVFGRLRAWADNIESIALEGSCHGDWMVIQGQGFGDPQPDNIALIAHTVNGCRELDVDPSDWSSTEIRVQMPNELISGAVGFYDKLAMNAFNSWVGDMNATATQVLAASTCLGRPLIFPTLQATLAIPCPPQTAVNVIAVGPPAIRYFQGSLGGNSAQTNVVSPGDQLELSWEVENAASLTLSRETAAGPDIPGSNPFGFQQFLAVTGTNSITLEPSSHTSVTSATYRLRAENDCGQVDRSVTFLLSKSPELEIIGIEVTQGMQTPEDDVALVAGKSTVVRLIGTHTMAEMNQPALPGVWGRIRYFNEEFPTGTGWDAPINDSSERPPEADFGARIDLPTSPNLGVTNDTVNFLIPEALCHGVLDIEVELRVQGAGGTDEIEGFSEIVSQRFDGFEFEERKPIRIRYIPVTVDPDTTGTLNMAPGISNPPTNQACRDLIEESLQQIPTTAESISRHDSYSIRISLDRTIIETPFGEFSRSLGYDIFGNSHLEWIRLIRICAFIDITGLLCPEDDDAYWAIIVPTDGGWGRAHIGGLEYLTPYRPITAAHELAHCLNQQHLAVQCPNGSEAPGGTDPVDFENNGMVTGIPFDILNNSALNGTIFDLMTYCSRRWVSAQRWQQMFDFVGPP